MASSLSRHLGRIRVPESQLRLAIGGEHESLAGWNALFGKCVVLDMQRRFDSMTIEYLIHCRELDPVDDGAEAPLYEAIFARDTSYAGGAEVVTYSVKFTKQP